VRLGVLDLLWASRVSSKELRGLRAAVGERGVDIEDACWWAAWAEKDMERSEVGVDSSMTGGWG
jgi:hypothetical protein